MKDNFDELNKALNTASDIVKAEPEEMKIVKREKKKHRKKMVKSREMTIEDLQAGIEDDDAIIRNMERKLGIKKVKITPCFFIFIPFFRKRRKN